MAFFLFDQNNSGGHFDFDRSRGITHYVIIEAATAAEANAKADEIGIYFNGCDSGVDCDCCGDRWYPCDGDGYEVPSVYGEPISTFKPLRLWMVREHGPDAEVVLHYADGSIAWGGLNG